MNHATSPRTEHLFIVRVWWEPDGVTATAQWRGSVQHGTTNRRYFASREEMIGYLDEWTTHTGNPIDASEVTDTGRTPANHTAV